MNITSFFNTISNSKLGTFGKYDCRKSIFNPDTRWRVCGEWDSSNPRKIPNPDIIKSISIKQDEHLYGPMRCNSKTYKVVTILTESGRTYDVNTIYDAVYKRGSFIYVYSGNGLGSLKFALVMI